MSPTNDLPPTVSLRKKRYLGKIHLTCFWSSTDYKLIKSAEFNYVIALDLKLNSDWLFHYSKSSVLRDCIRTYVIHSVWHFYLNFWVFYLKSFLFLPVRRNSVLVFLLFVPRVQFWLGLIHSRVMSCSSSVCSFRRSTSRNHCIIYSTPVNAKLMLNIVNRFWIFSSWFFQSKDNSSLQFVWVGSYSLRVLSLWSPLQQKTQLK